MIGHFLYRYIVKHDFEKKVTLESEDRNVYTESKTRTGHRELIKLNANFYIFDQPNPNQRRDLETNCHL